MFTQVDVEGNRYILFEEIIYQRNNGSEVKQQYDFITTRNGKKNWQETRKCWEILVQWRDGSLTSIYLKGMKNYYPVQLAEYAVQRLISVEPVFSWWVQRLLINTNKLLVSSNLSTGCALTNVERRYPNMLQMQSHLMRITETHSVGTHSGGIPYSKK